MIIIAVCDVPLIKIAHGTAILNSPDNSAVGLLNSILIITNLSGSVVTNSHLYVFKFEAIS